MGEFTPKDNLFMYHLSLDVCRCLYSRYFLIYILYHCPVPQETGAYQASGNTVSCTAQGFFDSFFYGLSVIMNSVLAITYCIIVKRGKKDEATRVTRRMVSAILRRCNTINIRSHMLFNLLTLGTRSATNNMSFASYSATFRPSV